MLYNNKIAVSVNGVWWLGQTFSKNKHLWWIYGDGTQLPGLMTLQPVLQLLTEAVSLKKKKSPIVTQT